MSCFEAPERRWPQHNVDPACYHDLNEIYDFLQVRRGAAQHRLGTEIYRRVRRPDGPRLPANEDGSLALWTALRLQREVDLKKRLQSAAGDEKEFWVAVERNEAKRIKRRARRKWIIRRLREKAQPRPEGYGPSVPPTTLSSDEELPVAPTSLRNPTGIVMGDFLRRGHRSTRPRLSARNQRRVLARKEARRGVIQKGKRPRPTHKAPPAPRLDLEPGSSDALADLEPQRMLRLPQADTPDRKWARQTMDEPPSPSALPPPAFIKFPRPRPETRSTSQATSLHEMVGRNVIVKTTAPPPLGPIPAGPLLAQFERHPSAAPSRCHPSHPRWAPPIPPAVSIGYLLASSRPSPMEMFRKNMEILRAAGQSRRPGICFLRRLQCLPQRFGLPTRNCTHRRLRSETIGSSFHFGNNLWEIRARRAPTTICFPGICVAAAPLRRPRSLSFRWTIKSSSGPCKYELPSSATSASTEKRPATWLPCSHATGPARPWLFTLTSARSPACRAFMLALGGSPPFGSASPNWPSAHRPQRRLHGLRPHGIPIQRDRA